MSSISSYSLSGDNCLINKELSFDCNFDENDFKLSNLSPNTFFSTTTAECKYKYILIKFKFFFPNFS